MNRIINIFILAVAVVAAVSCEEKISHETIGDTPIYLTPEFGYIFFDTDVPTRGNLINGSLPYDFGVVGYQFSGTNWTGYKAKAKPNVFSGQTQTISWNGTSHYYEPLLPWSKNTYAFFAYYPHSLKVNGNNASYEGTPYVEYTIDRNDPTKLVDVMTASDKSATVAQRSVTFEFEHRLSALSLYARSSVNKAVFETLKNETSVGEVYVDIKYIHLTLKNLEYDKVRIPLDSEEKMTSSQTGSKEVTYNNISQSQKLNYFITNTDQVDLTAGNKTLVLIPQSGMLTCQVSVKYDLVNAAGTSVWDLAYPTMTAAEKTAMQNQTQTVEIDGLDPKVRYFLILNFTKTGLSVDATKAAQWTDVPVDYEFE